MQKYRELVTHPSNDDFWKPLVYTVEDFKKTDIPILHLAGQFDIVLPANMWGWTQMAKFSPAANQQHLYFGPWEHGPTEYGNSPLEVRGQTLSTDSSVDMKMVRLAFYDHYLKQSTKSFDFPRARVYVTGLNEWRDLDQYPAAGVKTKAFYLSSFGNANTRAGGGKLVTQKPGKENSDHFEFDPQDPVKISEVGFHENRDDVLVYTSDALDETLVTMGAVSVELYAATDGRDTDFSAMLVDVGPDGKTISLGDRGYMSVIRARYRNGMEKEELLDPGKMEKYTIDLGHIVHAFLPRHKIRLLISSSGTLSNPNQNTGNPIVTDTEWRVAQQTIFHGKGSLSSLKLPVSQN